MAINQSNPTAQAMPATASWRRGGTQASADRSPFEHREAGRDGDTALQCAEEYGPHAAPRGANAAAAADDAGRYGRVIRQ